MKTKSNVLKYLWLSCLVAGATVGGEVSGPEKIEKQEKVKLLIDVDFFDNMTVAKMCYNRDFYGPKEIAEFFENCRKTGIDIVYWRCMTQIANYRSKLNYNLAQAREILSNADIRRKAGAFAAKVGVGRKKCRLADLKNVNYGGIVQKVSPGNGTNFSLSGEFLAPAPGAFLIAIDAVTGKIISKGKNVISPDKFQSSQLSFKSNNPFYVGAMVAGGDKTYVFIVDEMSIKTQSGKELLQNGNMEKHHMLQPVDWKMSGADFVTLNGDSRKTNSKLQAGIFRMIYRPYTHEMFRKTLEACDPLAEAVKQARKNGIKLYAWLDPIDDGRLVLPPVTAWSSRFMEKHPEFRSVDENGAVRWGQLCFGYPEVRKHKIDIVKELLSYGVDGIALKIDYQHCSAWDGNSYNYKKFLYNDVALKVYNQTWGKPANGRYETFRLQLIYGNFFIQWLRELRPVMQKAGKRLCLFTRPGRYADPVCGSWIISKEKIIRERLIDDLLLEPRTSGDNRDGIKQINKEFGYSALCRRYGIKIGYDYYLNGMVERVRPANKHAYFREQMAALIKDDIDFLGIYEGMYVDKFNLWPDIKYISQKIANEPFRNVASVQLKPSISERDNLALIDKGAKAVTGARQGSVVPAQEVIDGERSNVSNVCFTSVPAVVEIIFPKAQVVKTVKIYPGNLSYLSNPSGICGISDYRLEGKLNGKWIKLVPDVKNASSKPVGGELCYIHNFKPLRLSAVKLTILKSGDTGCRVFSPKVPVVKPESRVTIIREIEVYGN